MECCSFKVCLQVKLLHPCQLSFLFVIIIKRVLFIVIRITQKMGLLPILSVIHTVTHCHNTEQ